MKLLKWLIWPILIVDLIALKFFGTAISLDNQGYGSSTPQEMIGLIIALLVLIAIVAYWIVVLVKKFRKQQPS